MVEIRTPSRAPAARPAEQVSNATAAELKGLSGSLQGVADKYSAYYEQKAADNADLIWAQTQADWSRKFNETSPKAGEGYARDTLQDFDSYVDQVMPTVPERQQENMQHMFAKYRINLESKSLQAEAVARARERAKQKAETQRLRGLAMLEDPSFENYQMLSDGLNDAERANLFGVYADATLKGGDRFDVENLRSLVEDTDTFDTLLTADQKLQVMEGIDKFEAAQAREDAVEIDQSISDIGTNAANSGEVRGEHMDLALEQIEFSALTDAEKAEARAALRDSANMGKELYDIRRMPISESAANLRQMRADAETEAEWDRVNAYANAQAAHTKAYNSDAAGYVQSIAYGAADEFAAMQSAETPEDQREAAQSYVWRMDDQYHLMGVSENQRRYLPEGVADSMVSSFNENATGLTGPQLEQHLNTWGDAAGQIEKELIGAGLDDYVVAQLWRPYDPLLNEMISFAKAANIEETKGAFKAMGDGDVSPYKTLENDVYTQLEDYFNAFTAGRGPEAETYMLNMARVAVDTYMVHKVNGGTMDLDKFVGRMFSEEPFVSDNLVMLIPEGESASDISSKVDWLLGHKALDLVRGMDQELVARIAAEENVEVDEATMSSVLRSNGMFVLNDAGDGVRLGYNMKGMFIPLDPSFTFEELNGIRSVNLGDTIDGPTVAGTIVEDYVSGEPEAYGQPGTVVIRQPVELEYDSSEPYYQEDIDSGDLEPGTKVILDGKVHIVP